MRRRHPLAWSVLLGAVLLLVAAVVRWSRQGPGGLESLVPERPALVTGTVGCLMLVLGLSLLFERRDDREG